MGWLNRTSAAYTELGIQLGKEELLLPITAFGTDWKTIRIAVRYTVLANISNQATLSNAYFRLGVCSNGIGYAASNTVAWIGAAYYLYSATATYYNNGGDTLAEFKTGVSVSAISSYYNAGLCAARWPSRGVYLLNVSRYPTALATSSYVLAPYAMTTSVADHTFTAFIEAAQNYTTPGANFTQASYPSGFTLLPGQTFDTVSLYWNKCFPVFEIYDVAVYRVY